MRDHLPERLAAETDPRCRMELIEEALRPPEPQLLDTCVLQNVDWIHRQSQLGHSFIRDDGETAKLERRYGSDLAEDLMALNVMYRQHQYHSGYPWLVCKTALEEAQLLRGAKGESLRQLIEFVVGHQEDWGNNAYPGVAHALLLAKRMSRVSPLDPSGARRQIHRRRSSTRRTFEFFAGPRRPAHRSSCPTIQHPCSPYYRPENLLGLSSAPSRLRSAGHAPGRVAQVLPTLLGPVGSRVRGAPQHQTVLARPSLIRTQLD
jgi:hypothetical protein